MNPLPPEDVFGRAVSIAPPVQLGIGWHPWAFGHPCGFCGAGDHDTMGIGDRTLLLWCPEKALAVQRGWARGPAPEIRPEDAGPLDGQTSSVMGGGVVVGAP